MFEDTPVDNDEDWNAGRERERGIWMATTKAIEWVSEIEKAEKLYSWINFDNAWYS